MACRESVSPIFEMSVHNSLGLPIGSSNGFGVKRSPDRVQKAGGKGDRAGHGGRERISVTNYCETTRRGSYLNLIGRHRISDTK
jgi:hypothetical protein